MRRQSETAAPSLDFPDPFGDPQSERLPPSKLFMNMHALMPYIFIAVFLAFVIWSVVRGRRWEKYQAEAARRAKTIMEAASSDRERFAEVMSVSREHLEVTKELLSEIKSLRNDLTRNEGPNG